MCVCVLVAQSCPTLGNPMDCSPPGSSVHGILRQEYWNGLPFTSPGDLPDPGIKPVSPALQADALPSELLEKSLVNVYLEAKVRSLRFLSINTLAFSLLYGPTLTSVHAHWKNHSFYQAVVWRRSGTLPREDTPRPRSEAAAVRRYPRTKARSSSCASLDRQCGDTPRLRSEKSQ